MRVRCSAGTIAFMDLTSLDDAGNVSFCYTYGYQYALKAQQAGALALLVRAKAGSFEPRSKYLLPAPLRIPTFGTEHDQSQLIVAGVAAGTARITLPALVGALHASHCNTCTLAHALTRCVAGGLGPAYYPSVMADMETSSMSVYVNRSAVSAFYCDLGQSLFQPLAWPGAPVPVAALLNTSAADFTATHRFLHARPTDVCAASATCAACIEAGVHNRTSQMVTPPEIAAGLLAGAKYTLYAYGAAYPCITGFAELTDMAVALNASALVIVLGSDVDRERTSTLIDSASYVATIPTFNMDYACYDRVLQRANASLPVHVSLPQLIGGVAVGAGVEAPAVGGVTRDPITTATPTPQSVGIPATYLLARRHAARACMHACMRTCFAAARLTRVTLTLAGANDGWVPAVRRRALPRGADVLQPAGHRGCDAERHLPGALHILQLRALLRALRRAQRRSAVLG
jgi:hypothetical protein